MRAMIYLKVFFIIYIVILIICSCTNNLYFLFLSAFLYIIILPLSFFTLFIFSPSLSLHTSTIPTEAGFCRLAAGRGCFSLPTVAGFCRLAAGRGCFSLPTGEGSRCVAARGRGSLVHLQHLIYHGAVV